MFSLAFGFANPVSAQFNGGSGGGATLGASSAINLPAAWLSGGLSGGAQDGAGGNGVSEVNFPSQAGYAGGSGDGARGDQTARAAFPGTLFLGGTSGGSSSAARGAAALGFTGGQTVSGTAGTGNDTGWRIFSPPVTGATRGDLTDDVNMTVTSGSVLYGHDGSGYVAITADGTALPSGQGFLLYVFDDAIETVGTSGMELDFPGDPPTVDVTVSSLGQDEQWHLLGNPFDRSFDLSSLNLVAQGFQATVQAWNPATSSWTPFTQEAGSGDVIAPWQGFFVERSTLNAGADNLTFQFGGRTSGGTLIGGKRGFDAAVRVGLTLVAEDSSGVEMARDESAGLFFKDGATPEWDAFDATKQRPPLSSGNYAMLTFPAVRDGELVDLVQRSHPARWSGYELFPLAVRTRGTFDRFRISWPSLEIPGEWEVWLEDTETGMRTDMLKADDYLVRGAVSETRLQVVVRAASSVRTDAEDLPRDWALHQAYPNPFNPLSTISFEAPVASQARLAVYDVLGRRVALLVDGSVPAGRHEFQFDGSGLHSGLYVYMLETPRLRFVKTVVLVK